MSTSLKPKTCAGFTLVEAIVYIALTGMFLGAAFPFALNLSGLLTKAGVEREVSVTARIIGEEIVDAIRSAEGVDAGASTFGSDSGRLVLDLFDTSDALAIDTADGTLRFRSGSADPVALHGASVRVTRLVFENRSSDDKATEHVDFSITVESSGARPGRSEYQASVSVEGGAEVRSNAL